ncbi:unnamed protein product, partial [Mesorhabditis spiculigera]
MFDNEEAALAMCDLNDSESAVEQSEKIKDFANTFFKNGHYGLAAAYYTMAIDHHPTAVLYANRSMAHLRRELYGSALEDSSTAIELDPTYIKGYYRRAAANMALGRYKKALKDYATVVKARPKDKDAVAKHSECSKIVKRIAFERAIATDHGKKVDFDVIAYDAIPVDDKYQGPRWEGDLSAEFVLEMTNHFKKQQALHKKYAYKILVHIYEFFKKQPTLVDIKVADGDKFTICGDVHGQFYDLLNIFEINGRPSEENPYLFNGDFVDRGSFSVETIFTLFAYKLLYPNHFYLSRGNHESDTMNKMYGFEGEVKHKFSDSVAVIFTEVFCHLPLCHLINEKVFVCHGGLFNHDGVTLDDIRNTDRVRQPPDEGIMCDLLWSDPQPIDGRTPSKRGVGCQFGPDVSQKFCEKNGISYVVRSHEVKPEGFEKHHDGRVYTVFSAPNYCDQMGNKGAFIRLQAPALTPRFTSFSAVPHPDVPPMAPSTHDNPDTCIGHCALSFVESIGTQLGPERAVSLLQLNYNDFLRAFSNTTFFETFCGIYHNFQNCASSCEPGYLHQMLMRSSEIIDHYCVYNRKAIATKFPCLSRIAPSEDCLKSCTSHHSAVTSLIGNFRHLAMSGDTSQAEKYLEEGCEYVICSLHCDVPTIAHTCDFDTANLVINLTRRSFDSMESLSLDMGALKKWPKMCEDIRTYRLPQPQTAPTQVEVIAAAPIVPTTPLADDVPKQAAPVVQNGAVVPTLTPLTVYLLVLIVAIVWRY